MPYAYDEVRPLLVAETRLKPGEAEAKVLAWSPPLEVVALPSFAGSEPSGFTIYSGQAFVFLRRETVKHTPAGHGGRSFNTFFYELNDGSGYE